MWNKIKRPLGAVLLIGIVALCVWTITPIQQKVHLGLDLQGGVRVTLELEPSDTVKSITSDVQNQVVQVVDNRVNGLGVSEPVISKVGTNRILVELPGEKDVDKAIAQLKEVAVLEFKIVPPKVGARARTDLKYANDPNGAYKDSGAVVYTGSEMKGASAAYGQGGEPQINFQTKDPKKFGLLTQKYMGQLLGAFLDKQLVSDATIEGVITDSGLIHGSFTEDDVSRIANELNAGALPVPITFIENETIGPTLGKIDLVKSLYASMLGLGLVLLFMIVMYRLPGLLADIALVIYVIMMFGLLAAAHATLTLPGIAGFVLSIGMAVDANVLIFERMKEELWAGKSMRASVRTGFARAFTAVFDSHFTTIVGAGVLFMLGTGTVKGFAYTLFWGTVFSLFTAVFITRFFVDLLVDNNVATNPNLYGVKPEEVGMLAKAGT